MKRSGLLIISICVFALLFLWFQKKPVEPIDTQPVLSSEKSGNSKVYHLSYRSGEDCYEDAYRKAGDGVLGGKVLGGVVTHHFFASGLIAEFFRKLEGQQNVETVIILAPNHFNAGFGEALVSAAYWDTPFGDLEPDNVLIQDLLYEKLVEIDEKPFESEHSISTIVPFIKKTFPDAKVVPVIMKEGKGFENCKRIADLLDRNSNGRFLVIASVDFSHGLSSDLAIEEDGKSISAIKSFDFDAVRDADIDSPPAVYTLLKFLDSQNARRLLFSRGSNSYLIDESSDENETVGYFIAHFGY